MASEREMPTLTKVEAGEGWTLVLRFEGDDAEYVADLTGLLARNEALGTLRHDPEGFRCPTIILSGSGIQWPVEWEGEQLDLSAGTLLRIAEEQRPMTGQDFAAWRRQLGLSAAAAAAVLGIGRRTVIDYENKDAVPTVVAIACRTLAADRTALAAHFVPQAPKGRPRKAA